MKLSEFILLAGYTAACMCLGASAVAPEPLVWLSAAAVFTSFAYASWLIL